MDGGSRRAYLCFASVGDRGGDVYSAAGCYPGFRPGTFKPPIVCSSPLPFPGKEKTFFFFSPHFSLLFVFSFPLPRPADERGGAGFPVLNYRLGVYI